MVKRHNKYLVTAYVDLDTYNAMNRMKGKQCQSSFVRDALEEYTGTVKGTSISEFE